MGGGAGGKELRADDDPIAHALRHDRRGPRPPLPLGEEQLPPGRSGGEEGRGTAQQGALHGEAREGLGGRGRQARVGIDGQHGPAPQGACVPVGRAGGLVVPSFVHPPPLVSDFGTRSFSLVCRSSDTRTHSRISVPRFPPDRSIPRRRQRPTTENEQRAPAYRGTEQEYLLSRELDEEASCARELKAPHFHRELVKRGVRIAMEEDRGRSPPPPRPPRRRRPRAHPPLQRPRARATADRPPSTPWRALFVFLANNSIVSEYQVAEGVGRLRRAMEDVRLDVPAARRVSSRAWRAPSSSSSEGAGGGGVRSGGERESETREVWISSGRWENAEVAWCGRMRKGRGANFGSASVREAATNPRGVASSRHREVHNK